VYTLGKQTSSSDDNDNDPLDCLHGLGIIQCFLLVFFSSHYSLLVWYMQ